jgi:sialidase-1
MQSGELKKFEISRDETLYEAFPDLAISPSGKLICVFLECGHHVDRSYSRIMFCESFDRGRTWSPKKALTEGLRNAGVWWNCPRIQQLKDGRMLVIVDRVYGNKMPEELKSKSEVVLYFSNDGGITWSGPVETPCDGIVPDKICETSTGRWLLSVHHRDPVSSNLAQRLWYSDDKGKSWNGPLSVASQKGLDLCEISIIPVDDKLVGLLRENSGIGLDCYKVISGDDGLTWSEPVAFPLPGCHRPVAGNLKDGRIMISYRFIQGGKPGSWTQNFFAAITDRQSMLAPARNGALARIRPVDFDRAAHSDTGYSGWVQFDNGEVYIVNYIVDDALKAHIRGYAMNIDEFFDPPKKLPEIGRTGNAKQAVAAVL